MNDFGNSLPMEAPTSAAAPVGLDAVTRAEIDIQISTAHAYPRSITRVVRNVNGLVSMSKESAEGCVFSLPRGGKPIVGPSIRLAEILFSQWGNCTGGSRVVEVNKREGYIEAEGVFHDLETNAKTVRRVRRSIKGRNGQVFSDDMIVVTGNAAGAIAFRNAVLAGVPRAVWSEAYDQAERLIKGDEKTLSESREGAMKAMAAFGLTAEEVCAFLGVDGLLDVGLDDIVTLRGLHNSLKEGSIDPETIRAEVQSKDAPKQVEKKQASGPVIEGNSRKVETDRKPVDRTPPKPAEKAKDPDPVTEYEPKKEAKEPEQEPKPKKEAAKPEPAEEPENEGVKSNDTQGSMLDEEAEQKAAPEKNWDALRKAVMADLEASGGDITGVVGFYGSQLTDMREHAKDVFDALEKEIGVDLGAEL